MGSLECKEFAISKRRQLIGTILVSLKVLGVQESPKRIVSTASALGAELDNVIGWIDGQNHQPAKANSPRKGIGRLASHRSNIGFKNATSQVLQLRESDESEDVETVIGAGQLAQATSKKGQPMDASEQQELVVTPRSDSHVPRLAGQWKCVATSGLEEFLKHTGVGAFQRKLALAARWPNWDFEVDGNIVKFVNHSAMGDLKENIPLDGSTYSWKDGRGNLFECQAAWEETRDGGCLRISRKGIVSGQRADYSEERRLSGDTLVFVLTHGDGVTWGRTFERSG